MFSVALNYIWSNSFVIYHTDQGSVSTSTAESEIKAVNHTLKGEVKPIEGS